VWFGQDAWIIIPLPMPKVSGSDENEDKKKIHNFFEDFLKGGFWAGLRWFREDILLNVYDDETFPTFLSHLKCNIAFLIPFPASYLFCSLMLFLLLCLYSV